MPTKRMRLPNGFGQISKIKSKRLREPYRAMITVGKTEEGRPICKILKPKGYFKTYNEAYEALMEYNKDPYDLTDLLTVEQLYDKWLPEYLKKVQAATARPVLASWKRCENIKEMLVRDLRSRHCKACIESAPTTVTKKNVQRLLNLMLDYAVEYDLTDRNYSRSVKISNSEPSESNGHIAFSTDELDTLWHHTDNSTVRMILVQCYSGWRPTELCDLLTENINTENWTMTGGMKTDAGKNRLVPIHKKIRDLVIQAKSAGDKYLFSPHLSYDTYKNHFYKTVKDLQLNPDHKPHDPRKTFVTLCKNAHVDEYAIKYMVGHAIKDITERVYTERDIEFLCTELNKV